MSEHPSRGGLVGGRKLSLVSVVGELKGHLDEGVGRDFGCDVWASERIGRGTRKISREIQSQLASEERLESRTYHAL
jgi:hypothetical protein